MKYVNTGVGCHFLLQGIFPIQGSNPGLLHCRQILYHLSHHRSPSVSVLPLIRALQKIHSGMKLYKCNEFQKTFAHKIHLSMHQRIHTDEKPYECCECEKTFSQKSYLSGHEGIHKGESLMNVMNVGKLSPRGHTSVHIRKLIQEINLINVRNVGKLCR